ncbi:hypothetical protein S83_001323, partial [Arachis hypogaea]
WGKIGIQHPVGHCSLRPKPLLISSMNLGFYLLLIVASLQSDDKIRAVLDQETWVEIDIPDEFQSIIKVVFSSDALHSESFSETDDVNSTSYNDVLPMSETGQSNAEQPEEQTKSTESPTTEHNVKNTEKDHKRSASQALYYKGVGYHMVNWLVISSGLILLKMLSEYIDMNNLLPPLSSEVVSGLKSSTSKHLALASQVVSGKLAWVSRAAI